ncbi:hypothetical protein QEG73_00925 [Chitinophagaceae bacterium 26-R-25]|nr:hypothetical protein [Chitinophagaceae bacterium 26-R-25]
MLSEKEISMLYETVLSSPGMNDNVKLAITMTRKNALLLSSLIDSGIANENGTNKLFVAAGEENVELVKKLSEDILEKAGLSSLHERLKALNGGK